MKAGFIGLVGLPNSGKSTLLNELIKEKVSIVSSKPQTTRKRVLGISSSKANQYIFVDSPGYIDAKKGLNLFLNQEAQSVIEESDLLVVLVALDEKQKSDVESVVDLVAAAKKPSLLVVTKCDLVEFHPRKEKIKEMLLEKGLNWPVIESSTRWGKDFETVAQQIRSWAEPLLPETPAPLYDPELWTPQTLREMTEEIIREKCFLHLHHEIPYSIAVRIREFDESRGDLVKISADIMVSKESHKPIVVGKGAATVKHIGMEARKDIEQLVGKKVFLKLEVVVKEDWISNTKLMQELGYHVARN